MYILKVMSLFIDMFLTSLSFFFSFIGVKLLFHRYETKVSLRRNKSFTGMKLKESYYTIHFNIKS